MNLTKTVLAIASLAATTAWGFCAGALLPDDERESLKGHYSAVAIKLRGEPAPAKFVQSFESTFDDKTYANMISQKVVEKGAYLVDASKTPKTIDFDITEGGDKGKKQMGIYKLDGDKLTLVIAEIGQTARPKSFTIKRGSPTLEVVLKRAKP